MSDRFNPRGSILLLILTWTTCFLLGQPSGAAANPLERLDRYTSQFDPLGRAFESLEEALPGLSVTGFIKNWSDFNLHGDRKAVRSSSGELFGGVGLGHRTKDWRAQMVQWLGELELHYRISPDLELVNIYNFLYDAVYDWQRSSLDPQSRTAEYYHTAERILRELYLNAYFGNWNFKLGKQQVVWGKMDGKFIDIINPEDNREVVQHEQDDYEWRRLPTWMVNMTYSWTDYSAQFLWIPDFQTSHGPDRGSAYWFPAVGPVPPTIGLTSVDEPSSHVKNHEWGLRLNMNQRGWAYSFIYFYTWDDVATYFRRGVNPQGILLLEPKHTRLHQLGASLETSFDSLGRNWVWRLEGIYTLNDYLDLKPLAAPPGHPGVVKRNLLKSATSLETNFLNGELTALFQPVFNYTFGYSNDLAARHLDLLWVFSLFRVFQQFDDRLIAGATVYHWPWSKTGGWKFKNFVSWKISNYMRLRFNYTAYSGNDDEPWGMYEKWDNLGLELSYDF